MSDHLMFVAEPEPHLFLHTGEVAAGGATAGARRRRRKAQSPAGAPSVSPASRALPVADRAAGDTGHAATDPAAAGDPGVPAPDSAARESVPPDSAASAAPLGTLDVLREIGEPGDGDVVGADGRIVRVPGVAIPVADALIAFAGADMAELLRGSGSVAAWGLASKLALELVARGRLVPTLRRRRDGVAEARWSVSLAASDDAARCAKLAAAMPSAAYAVPVGRVQVPGARAPGEGRARRAAARSPSRAAPPTETAHGLERVPEPQAHLRRFLDDAADALVRLSVPPRSSAASRAASRGRGGATAPVGWETRFTQALTAPDASFDEGGFRDRQIVEHVEEWAAPVGGAARDRPRVGVRLELPPDDAVTGEAPEATAPTSPAPPATAPAARRTPRRRAAPADAAEPSVRFKLSYFLHAADDPSLVLEAADVWARTAAGRRLSAFRDADEHLLRGLAVAGRVFPPVERSLADARPVGVELGATEAWDFLSGAAGALGGAGITVVLPAEMTTSGRRRLRLRMRVGASAGTAGVVQKASGVGFAEIVDFRWEAAVGDTSLSVAELEALALQKVPLVRIRGQWVAVDAAELDQVRKLVAAGGGRMSRVQAVSAALAGSSRTPGVAHAFDVVADGAFAAALDRIRSAADVPLPEVIEGFVGTLRPYQRRGVAWLASLSSLGLGACLADDMGLGKTVQVLAYLLARRSVAPSDTRPVLLVCPTSVVGNWERESARFAPSIAVTRHHGTARSGSSADIAAAARGGIVVTTYGLLRRDAAVLAEVDWAAVVLDEAQNAKNAASRTFRAARALRASDRIALTGTPVENRLAELWSISEFCNPGLLGPLETFRRDVAVPIERWRDTDAAGRLRRVVGPFLLRRVKTDPAVISDLPEKEEMKVFCSLTPEQATLYRAALEAAMERIQGSDGIRRRGNVLALLTHLKQICNHPAQFLGESGPLPGRSGKLARLTEMLEEAVASGDRALVFTQYREMGDRLVRHLGDALGCEIPFLHGGVSRDAREEMVRRFQSDDGPRVFVLSLKAGGTGLNLTRANQVFHFDRWWNPAVEDQATDRAYRIGQVRRVQVRKLLAAGTVEEKVDRMITEKKELAASVIATGERWITELDDASLREVFSLTADAVISGEPDREPAEVSR